MPTSKFVSLTALFKLILFSCTKNFLEKYPAVLESTVGLIRALS